MRQADLADLDPSSIVDEAGERVGALPRSIQPRPQFLQALERLTNAIDAEARLHAAGRVAVRCALVGAMTNQLRVEADLAVHPQTADIAFRPLCITGLYRSGTTFLQNLLSHHPQLRVPPLWELLAPASDEPRRRLIDAAGRYVKEYYRIAPRFREIHELHPLLPEECHRLLGLTFANPIYGLRYRVPSYLDWLDAQRQEFAYAFHKQALQCLLRRRPGQVVALKCPTHLWHLPALAQVYPEAKVVVLHRTPVATIPSLCNLTAVVRAARSEQVDRYEIGEFWLTRAADALTRRHEYGGLRTPPLQVRYADLIADPIATVERICEYAGIEATAAALAPIRGYLDGQDRGAHSANHLAEDFGLTADLLEAKFRDYIAEHRL